VEKLAASRTALATSLMRAAHTRLDPHPLIDDPWGDRLVPESVKRAMASPNEVLDESLMRSRSYANVITRSRYAEDALQAAVSKGVGQYVLMRAQFHCPIPCTSSQRIYPKRASPRRLRARRSRQID
jgi:O-methyltransferase involved in polyketide biosynthesis